MNFSTLKPVVAAGLFLSVAVHASHAHADDTKQELFLEQANDIRATVEKQGTTCSLVYIHRDKAIMFMIGKTVVTSQITFIFPTDFGSHGGTLQLELVTRERDPARTADFSKSRPSTGFSKFSTALSNLQIDLDDLERTFAFHLSDPAQSGSTVTLHFSDELRDRAVEALNSCAESLESHWSAD